MYIVITETKDEDGVSQGCSWSNFDTEAEARTEYKSALTQTNVLSASYGSIIASTKYEVKK